RTRELPRVGELAPEIETGEEAEDLAQRNSLRRSQPPRQVEARPGIQDDLRAPARAARRRQEEDPARHARNISAAGLSTAQIEKEDVRSAADLHSRSSVARREERSLRSGLMLFQVRRGVHHSLRAQEDPG